MDVRRATVDIAVPIYNESDDLESSIVRLRRYLDDRFPFPTVVTIVDNASTDGSWALASMLARRLPGVRAMHLDQKGRGRALREAWTTSEADVVVYMDVDLSTGLDALLPLVAPLVSRHGDVAIGSRLAHGARVFRGPKRELISRLYNLILRVALRSRFTDAQCGFKAMRAEDARVVLPLVLDNEWFFDTELLVVAERAGLRVSEVPVDWADDPHSSVHIADTAIKDLRGVWRMFRAPRSAVTAARSIRSAQLPASLSELLGATRLGGAGMAVYASLFIVLARSLPLVPANLSAVALGVGAGVALRSRRPHDARSAVGPWPRTTGAALVVGTSAAATTAVLWATALIGVDGTASGLAAATLGMAGAALARFLIGRSLVFRTGLDRSLHRTESDASESDAPATLTASLLGEDGGRDGSPPPLDAVDLRPIRTDADMLAHR